MSKTTYSFEAANVATPRNRAKFGLAGLVAAGALALGLAGAAVLPSVATQTANADEVVAIDATGDNIYLAEQVAEKCLPSMGCVYALIENDTMSGIAQGSCEVINEEGILLTNYHVVDGATKVEVAIAGESFEAEIVGSDPTSDLAVLRIDPGETELVPIAIGTSSDLRVGQWVMTLGAPKGESESVSQGIISGLDRSSRVEINSEIKAYYVGLIQSDAMINEGSSGGAMVNANGELIGVTTLIATSTGEFAGMSYAIPIDYVMDIAGQILQDGTVEHPLFGANVTSIASAYYNGFYEPDENSSLLGAYVYSVVEGMGADKAGIEPGDIVISIGDQEVYSPEDLILAIRGHKIGEEVTITVLRNGEELDFQVTLGSDQDDAVTSRTVEDGQSGEDDGEAGGAPFSFFDFIGGQGGSDSGNGQYGNVDPYGYYGYTDPYGYYGYGNVDPYGYYGYGNTAPYGYYGYGNTAPYGYYGYGNVDPYGYYGYYGNTAPYGYYGNPGQGGYGQYEYYGYPDQGYGNQDDSGGNGLWEFWSQLGDALGIGF